IKQIINSFTDDKQQEFIRFLNKKNKRKDAKNVKLIQLLMNESLSSKEISLQLYKKDNKVALHALRKRLFQSIIEFTANINLNDENSIDIQLIKYIVAARAFLKQGQINVGYKVLDKVEITANELQLFSILNEVYHTQIEYAHQYSKINFNALVEKFHTNQKQHQLEEKLNIAYAKIRITLNEIQHQQKVINIKSLINNVLDENSIVVSEGLSFKSLYQIIEIVNISSSQNFEYWNIESYLLETYNIVKTHKAKEKQLYYHIKILYLIANTLFRNKKFTASLEFLELMNLKMYQNKKKYLKEFNLKNQLLLALNHNYIGNQVFAINLLTPFINKKNIDLVSQLDIYLSLIVFYSQKNELKKAQSLFAKFYHSDKWYIEKTGIEWVIKKNLIEILLQIDLGNIDIVDSRVLSFKRSYFKHLKKINQQKVITYLKLVEIYYKNPEKVTSYEFHQKVEGSFEWITKEKEDIFMMSFYAWLKAKMIKKDVYLVTLDLINQSVGF
ncbi:MAG: hypothetical protein AB8B78_14820, partial [Polaribacter sp.]